MFLSFLGPQLQVLVNFMFIVQKRCEDLRCGTCVDLQQGTRKNPSEWQTFKL